MKTSIEKAVEYFRMKDYFTSEELWEFWRKRDHDLNRNTYYRRVYRLKKEAGLNEILNNTYTFSKKPPFQPQKENILKRITNLFKSRFIEIDYCIWQTAWLHEFMIHQPGRQFVIFETEKDIIESVFFLLKSPERQVLRRTAKQRILAMPKRRLPTRSKTSAPCCSR